MPQVDLTLAELARQTGRHVETLRRLARTGELPGAYKLGGKWGITRPAADLLRHVPAGMALPREEGGDDAR